MSGLPKGYTRSIEIRKLFVIRTEDQLTSQSTRPPGLRVSLLLLDGCCWVEGSWRVALGLRSAQSSPTRRSVAALSCGSETESDCVEVNSMARNKLNTPQLHRLTVMQVVPTDNYLSEYLVSGNWF